MTKGHEEEREECDIHPALHYTDTLGPTKIRHSCCGEMKLRVHCVTQKTPTDYWAGCGDTGGESWE